MSETEFPEVTVATVPQDKTVKVRLSGYNTGLYRYVEIPGHESMVPGEKDPDSMVSQTTKAALGEYWGLQITASGKIVSRTVNELRRRGFVIARNDPQYVIGLSFEGPQVPEYDIPRMLGFALCTLFTAEKNEVTWKAKLTVSDSKKNVLFTKDYEQNYCTTVWGPIPVASPACHPMTTNDGASSWALTALSDRALADAAAFIVGQIK